MLPKEERLRKNSEFMQVYRKKQSVANLLLVLYVGNKKKDVSTPTKVGFIVGKKVHKKAVRRNRIKRLMREAYKSLKKKGGIPLGDYERLIFIARPAAVDADYYQILSAVADCVKRVKIS